MSYLAPRSVLKSGAAFRSPDSGKYRIAARKRLSDTRKDEWDELDILGAGIILSTLI